MRTLGIFEDQHRLGGDMWWLRSVDQVVRRSARGLPIGPDGYLLEPRRVEVDPADVARRLRRGVATWGRDDTPWIRSRDGHLPTGVPGHVGLGRAVRFRQEQRRREAEIREQGRVRAAAMLGSSDRLDSSVERSEP